jgi:chorismate synthase
MFRPGHADITFHAKYGIRDWRGGGRASARETAARVAAGAVAQKVLDARRIRVSAYTRELGGVRAKRIDPAEVFANPYGCPDPDAVEKMESRIALVRAQGDSVGGIVEVIAHGVPAGLGEPVFGKLDADLAGALMGIGAVKGVEIGDGFAVAGTTGSTNNDPITPEGFSSNHAGGILGGISSGADIVIRVAVKPIPSISIPQQTVTVEGKPETIQIRGRHDISAIPRINAVCEAMVRLVLADHLLRQQALCFVA